MKSVVALHSILIVALAVAACSPAATQGISDARLTDLEIINVEPCEGTPEYTVVTESFAETLYRCDEPGPSFALLRSRAQSIGERFGPSAEEHSFGGYIVDDGGNRFAAVIGSTLDYDEHFLYTRSLISGEERKIPLQLEANEHIVGSTANPYANCLVLAVSNEDLNQASLYVVDLSAFFNAPSVINLRSETLTKAVIEPPERTLIYGVGHPASSASCMRQATGAFLVVVTYSLPNSLNDPNIPDGFVSVASTCLADVPCQLQWETVLEAPDRTSFSLWPPRAKDKLVVRGSGGQLWTLNDHRDVGQVREPGHNLRWITYDPVMQNGFAIEGDPSKAARSIFSVRCDPRQCLRQMAGVTHLGASDPVTASLGFGRFHQVMVRFDRTNDRGRSSVIRPLLWSN